MKVLLPINPEYARKIFDGSKKYEFRRVIFKNKDVNTIVVYATNPIKRIIGEFEIEYILHDEIKKLWEITKDNAGISENLFKRYFSDKTKGYAIKIKNPKKYDKKLTLKDINKNVPQSFIYLGNEI